MQSANGRGGKKRMEGFEPITWIWGAGGESEGEKKPKWAASCVLGRNVRVKTTREHFLWENKCRCHHKKKGVESPQTSSVRLCGGLNGGVRRRKPQRLPKDRALATRANCQPEVRLGKIVPKHRGEGGVSL